MRFFGGILVPKLSYGSQNTAIFILYSLDCPGEVKTLNFIQNYKNYSNFHQKSTKYHASLGRIIELTIEIIFK